MNRNLGRCGAKNVAAMLPVWREIPSRIDPKVWKHSHKRWRGRKQIWASGLDQIETGIFLGSSVIPPVNSLFCLIQGCILKVTAHMCPRSVGSSPGRIPVGPLFWPLNSRGGEKKEECGTGGWQLWKILQLWETRMGTGHQLHLKPCCATVNCVCDKAPHPLEPQFPPL